ncbi:glycosyltransferase [Uliginosibacterium sp. H3]|uniref:Glycosyltransferase n=1 Tax=Uliginosibacterium silvisoli TaxID=3114758 RepID=A0ABU6JZZ4_9RHOO|nr:glycosyltransferase [Uliginosibacterium sp. H3]
MEFRRTALPEHAHGFSPARAGLAGERLPASVELRSPTGRTPCRRIGLLIDSLIGGGAERVVLNLAAAFHQLGHQVHVIVVRNEIQHTLPAGIPVHVLQQSAHSSGSKFIDKLVLAWRMRALVASLEKDGKPFDFFVSSAEDSDRLSAMAGLTNVYIRYRNSMVEYLHHKIGHKTGLKRLWREFKWRAHFQSVYGGRDIITVSDAMHDDIINGAGVQPRSLRTIYNPFDFDAIRREADAYTPDMAEPYVVYVARFNSRKRQDLLLDAYARSAARTTHKLVLIGDAYTASERDWLDKMKLRIAKLGLEHRVVLPGFQTNPYPWIRNAALFAMSSDSEGLPTVLIESLILGTPVVSTDCPTGPSEILTGPLARFLCPRDNAEALTSLIDQALLHYPAISEAQLSRFSARHSAQQYLAWCVARKAGAGQTVLRRSGWWSA